MISEKQLDALLSRAMQANFASTGSGIDLSDRIRAKLRRHDARPRRLATAALLAAGALALTGITALAANIIIQTLHVTQSGLEAITPVVTTLADVKARAGFHVLTLSGLESAHLDSVAYQSIQPLPSERKVFEPFLYYSVGSQQFLITEFRSTFNPLDVKIQQLHTTAGPTPSPYGYEAFETLNGHKYLVERTVPGGGILSISWKTADGVVIGITATSHDGADMNTILSLIDHLK